MTCAPPQVRCGACLAILRTRIPRPHLKNQERALATTFSSTAVRTAESYLFGCPRRLLFSTLPMPAPLERSIRLPAPLAARGTICSTTRARASRPTTWSRHRHARMFLPLDTAPMRIQARPAPPAACDAGLVAAAFLHTVVQQHTAVTLCACACRTPLRRLRRFLRAQRARQSVPTACAAFIASSRIYVRLQQVSLSPTMGAPGASITRHARPPAGAAPAAAAPYRPCRGYHLPARCHCVPASLSSTRRQLLSGTGSTIRSTAEVRTKRPSSAPTLATARNLDLQPTASTILRVQHTLQLSPHRPYPLHFPRPSSAPYRPSRLRRSLPIASAGCVCCGCGQTADQRHGGNALPAPPLAPGSRYLRPHDDGPVQGDSGREAALYVAPGDFRSHGRPCDWNVRDTSPPFRGPRLHSEHRGTQGMA
ncbi:hypothetical protein DFH08DRAFT_433935 [Mycena albidolilacea]|uniref:Uncharacterized protein n=1 Tax=Mycena albidolilacea TaxID=1033008 RepID=A0AAD7ECX1_9AGAR|nr:hypothetical protein DFH08DRAFT_433935 [Mycena albidolilacea]